ncbi:MAG: Trigger factor [Parcubacteria group bacterium GW2011_GWA2_47_8]|nr:MAG: Trigger factor [Parcubacteria group bacterium GW2011_GWA2_47_8]OHB20528.1 MAG: trigger factor [Parcubacteria group bacterium RIFCSPHIGHO2_01_FULL_47_10b]
MSKKQFKTTVTDLDKQKTQVQVDVELTDEYSKQIFNAVSEKLSKEHHIEGFRPGNAPFHIVSQKLGADYVLHKALDFAFQKTYVDAIQNDDIDFWGMPQASMTKLAFGSPIAYRVVLHRRPTLKLPDLKKIKIKSQTVTATDDEVDAAIDHLRKSRASFVTVTRPAQKTDRVEIDFSATENGAPVDGAKAQHYPLIIGESQLIPGFDELLIGMKTGETKQHTLTLPKQGIVDHLAGKKLDFTITIHLVQERTLPSLDDAFAQRLSSSKTMPELKDSIGKGITQEKEQNEQRRRQIATLEEIESKVKIEIPDQVLDQETTFEVRQFRDDLAARGLEWQAYLKRIGKSEEEFAQTLRPQAKKRITHSLILDTIARDQNISASEDDVKQKLEAFKKANTGKAFEEADIADQIRRSLRTMKIFQYLEKHIRIK